MKNILLVIFLGLVILAQGQTKFKHKVFIKGKGIPHDSIKTLQDESLEADYNIFEVKQKEVIDTIKISKNSTLITTQEKKIKAVKYEIKKNIIIHEDSIIIYKKKVEFSQRFYLPKNLSST